MVAPFGYTVLPKKEQVDFVLYPYSNYDDYRSVQVFHNKRKLSQVWADDRTLERVVHIARALPAHGELIHGLCHGTRNGYEQQFFNSFSDFNVVGTDISPSATEFPNSFHWDFHDVKPEWVSSFDFVYSNSLDQAWNPRQALTTWLNQVRMGGVVIIEHTHAHGPAGASRMDPFGVRPIAMPYVLTDWFGDQISITHTVNAKANNGLDAWLFVCRKLVNTVL